MTLYTITVEMPSDIPADVVAEHVGAALKKFVAERTHVTVRLEEPLRPDYKTGGVIKPGEVVYAAKDVRDPNKLYGTYLSTSVRIADGDGRISRNHPFEGPEVFDDEVTPETITVTPRSITDSYPHLTDLLDQKRAEIKRQVTDLPPAEGDWQLNGDDKVGED